MKHKIHELPWGCGRSLCSAGGRDWLAGRQGGGVGRRGVGRWLVGVITGTTGRSIYFIYLFVIQWKQIKYWLVKPIQMFPFKKSICRLINQNVQWFSEISVNIFLLDTQYDIGLLIFLYFFNCFMYLSIIKGSRNKKISGPATKALPLPSPSSLVATFLGFFFELPKKIFLVIGLLQ